MTQEEIESGKGTAVISYLTIIGFVIAYFMNNDKKNEFASFHIRQSLGLWLTFFAIGLVVSNLDSWLASIGFYLFFGVLFLYAFMTALTGRTSETPILGKFYQRFFSSIGK